MLNLMPPPTVYCWTKMSALFISHVAGWRLTKTNNIHGLVQSLHKLLLRLLAHTQDFSPDNFEVCFFFQCCPDWIGTLDSKSWTTRLVYAFHSFFVQF